MLSPPIIIQRPKGFFSLFFNNHGRGGREGRRVEGRVVVDPLASNQYSLLLS